MTTTTSRYINLFTDFGFKKLFGEEPNKDLLIAFLNELLPPEEQIEALSYLKNEQLGQHEGERRAVYDLYCTNERGEKFIVEVQRVKQEYFKDRSVYYSTFAIQEQANGWLNWQPDIKGVYAIVLLDFAFDFDHPDRFEHRVKLLGSQTERVFYDKLTFIYLEIPKFNKELEELETDYQRWLYAFKNLHRLSHHPQELQLGIFQKLFDLAEIARLDDRDRAVYQESLKDYWDLKSAMDTYYKEGLEEGAQEKAIEMATKALAEGLFVDLIQKLTGLSRAEIEALQ